MISWTVRCILTAVSDLPSIVELLERLGRLEKALEQRDEAVAQRDARIEVLTRRVAELEAALRRNSRTSSKPPSSDGPAKPPPRSRREPTDRAPGKQPGDPGFTLRQVADPDEVITHQPQAWPAHRPVVQVIGDAGVLATGFGSSHCSGLQR